jgi:hypothetical protein
MERFSVVFAEKFNWTGISPAANPGLGLRLPATGSFDAYKAWEGV